MDVLGTNSAEIGITKVQVLLTVPSRTGEGGKAESEDEERGGDAGVQMKTPLPKCTFLQDSTDKKDNNFCLRKSLPKLHI